jgi:hypothetical protein
MGVWLGNAGEEFPLVTGRRIQHVINGFLYFLVEVVYVNAPGYHQIDWSGRVARLDLESKVNSVWRTENRHFSMLMTQRKVEYNKQPINTFYSSLLVVDLDRFRKTVNGFVHDLRWSSFKGWLWMMFCWNCSTKFISLLSFASLIGCM